MKQFNFLHEISLSKGFVLLAVGNVATIITNFFGGWSKDLNLLVVLMVIDFFMGFLIALFWKKSNKSTSGSISSISMWQGLCRKCITLAMVAIAAHVDNLLGISILRQTVIYAYCFNEIVSIAENAGIMGVPFPEQLTNAIEVLKNKNGKNGV